MSEKSREEEKLSFKEQILRDLERVKKHEEDQEEVDLASIKPQFSSKNDQSIEELMEDSLSAVEEIMRKAPTVPTHPSQDVPASPADDIQRETPGIPSHPSQDVPSSPAEEAVRQAPLAPSHPSQEGPSTPSAEGVSRPTPGPVSPRKVESGSYPLDGQIENVARSSVNSHPAQKKSEGKRGADLGFGKRSLEPVLPPSVLARKSEVLDWPHQRLPKKETPHKSCQSYKTFSARQFLKRVEYPE